VTEYSFNKEVNFCYKKVFFSLIHLIIKKEEEVIQKWGHGSSGLLYSFKF
jgi:hypothetical protein